MASSVDPTSPHSGKAVRNISSSWSHVSRGEFEPNSFAVPLASQSALPIASPELTGLSPRKVSTGPGSPLSFVGSDHGVSGNAADAVLSPMGKKSAWKFQSNGTIETGSIIDTVSWPALSESAKYSPKSVTSDLLKPVADVSVFDPPSVALSPSSKLALSNQNTGSSQNPVSPARQKSMKRGAVTGGSMSSSGSLNGGVAMPSSLQVSEANQLVPGKQPSLGFLTNKGLQNKNYGNMNNEKDHGSKAGGFSPQPYGGNEHQRGHGGVRRGSTGHHSNYGSRRDSERGGYEWNHQNLGRDVHMQQSHQQLGVRSLQRPPSIVVTPFIAPPPPLRPFSNHFGFPDFPSPVYYVAAPPLPEPLRGVPFASQASLAPQVMFFPAPDPQRATLLKQIEYYFSPENLCKDIYLRQNMDEQGWVPISLIAGFNRVKQLTNSIQYILDTIQLSSVVEVQGEKIRQRDDWMTWLLHPADHSGSASGLQSSTTSGYKELEGKFRTVCLDLEDAPNNSGLGDLTQNKVVRTGSASANKIVTCQ